MESGAKGSLRDNIRSKLSGGMVSGGVVSGCFGGVKVTGNCRPIPLPFTGEVPNRLSATMGLMEEEGVGSGSPSPSTTVDLKEPLFSLAWCPFESTKAPLLISSSSSPSSSSLLGSFSSRWAYCFLRDDLVLGEGPERLLGESGGCILPRDLFFLCDLVSSLSFFLLSEKPDIFWASTFISPDLTRALGGSAAGRSSW